MYLNRLSDYFYLLGRTLTEYFSVEETADSVTGFYRFFGISYDLPRSFFFSCAVRTRLGRCV